MVSRLFSHSLAGFSLCISSLAFSLPAYLKNFSEHYEFNGIDVSSLQREQSCGLCHVSKRGGGRLNEYGLDFRQITLRQRQGFPGIEFVDSNDDGFVNLEAIYLGVSPSDVALSDENRLELNVLEDSKLQVSNTESCQTLELKAFGSTFIEADPANNSVLSVATEGSEQIIDIDSGAGVILARCAEGNLVGSITLE